MQNSGFRPSLLMGSKNPMKVNDKPQNQSQIQNNNQKNINTKKNINNIKNRLFILSPTVKEDKDRECTRSDFSQETSDYTYLGYLGKALKVTHKKTNRLYSIKVISKDKLKRNDYSNTLNKYIEIMYKVDHCFFLKLLNHFEDEDNLYLVFQCINEGTLLDKIKLRTLTKEQIYKYFKQILEALQFLHSKKIFFISLEPESIIIDNDDNVRLTDYSYTKISNSEPNTRCGFKTNTNMFVNAYTAPELISYNKGILHKHRSKGSEKSDLWQVGILAYEMITGNLLFNKTERVDQFYKLITTPVIKNNEIIKKVSEIPDDYKIFSNIIMQLLDFQPKERISIENILNIKEIKNINYIKVDMEYNERIINLKNEDGSPQEQLIKKLKKENQKLKYEINNLNSKINELKKQNEDLNKQNIYFNKIINEEPNEDDIKKEVELKSQIRSLQLSSQLKESSLIEEKALNEALNKKISELEMDYNQNNLKNNEIIKELEKKIEDLENKLFNPINNGICSNEFLQYYLSLFNDNINQFTLLINLQNKKYNDFTDNNLSKLENFMKEKEISFTKKVNDIILKMSQNIILKSSGELSKNNNDLCEKNYKDKIVWLEKQIEELMPFKQKCLCLNEQVCKLNSDIEILKNKFDVSTKLYKEKEELNNLKLQNAKDKVKETFDKFISQNCPNKYDEFKLICQNFSFDS